MASEADDLQQLIRMGVARGGELLTAGEALICRRILALSSDEARLYARLTGRIDPISEVASLGHLVAEPARIVDELAALSLATRFVPRSKRKGGFTSGPHVRVCHGGLVRRLERWALSSRRRDRSLLVVERLGHQKWPEYETTGGGALFLDRRRLLAWETLWHRIDDLSADALLDALDSQTPDAPAGLSLRGSLVRRALEAARQFERDQRPADALAVYDRLATQVSPGGVAVRTALTLESLGRRKDALRCLRGALPEAGPVDRWGIVRTGRRLAKKLRVGWPPEPPIQRVPERDLRLLRAKTGSYRPLWGTKAETIEAAMITWLAGLGRQAVHAEGALWRTLYATLLASEAYFLPIEGMLPTRWLPGPLDAGRPGFRRRRQATVDMVLGEVENGGAPNRIRAGVARWQGVIVAGMHPEFCNGPLLEAVALGMGGPSLAEVLRTLCDHGFQATRGLPDLVILPGEPISMPGAFPSRLPSGLVLAELKSPTDSLRDAQRVWLSQLRRLGCDAEIWNVRPTTAGPPSKQN
jgi:hypothetical protein